MTRFDDDWCEEARAIIRDLPANILVCSLDRKYGRADTMHFDVVASGTTGTDHIHADKVISLKGETDFLNGVYGTAEHTMALILALARKIPWAYNDVKQGNWNREAWQGMELHGKTLGIVGFGRVGNQVWEIARALGMGRLIAERDDGDWIDTVIEKSDIVTVHVPLDAETRYMFGKRQFTMMKPSALFINTSRGEVVDEDALIDALRNGVIAGAAVDVLKGEPHPKLTDLPPNLLVTPHIAGNTAESRRTTQLFMAQKIKDYVERGG